MKTYKHIITLAAFVLASSAALYAKDDSDSTKVILPWNGTESFWGTASSVRSYDASRLENSAASDIRNRLTGLIRGLEVIELNGSSDRNSSMGEVNLTSSSESIFSRGRSSVVCILDDVPVSMNQLRIDPNQIESITLLNDVTSKALYGPIASNGALYIKTKTGSYNTPLNITADIESGLSFVDRWPEWVSSGAEYATINNQARIASGRPALYSNEYISGLKGGSTFDREYPNVDYRSLMFKESKPVTRFGVNVNGGSSNVKYNFSLNGLDEGNIYNAGPADDYYKLNTTMNVTAKFNEYIEATAAFTGLISFSRLPGIEFGSYRTVAPNAFPLAFGTSLGQSSQEIGMVGTPIYAVSKLFTDNPYAELAESLGNVTKHRSGMFNIGINIDFSWLIPGLKSRTFANLNTYFNQSIGQTADYYAYYWDMDTDMDEVSDHIAEKASGKSVTSNFTYQGLAIYERLDYDYAKSGHKLNTGLTYYMSNDAHSSNTYAERMQNFIGNVNWSYKDKYIAQVVADYSGTTRFETDQRWAFFPTASVAWVPTKEDFLSSSTWLDNLKVYAQAGLIGDIDLFGTYYLYQGKYSTSSGRTYGPYESNCWFGSTTQTTSHSTTIDRMENHNLTWAKMLQYEAGIDAELFGAVNFSIAGYVEHEKGIITNTNAIYPDSFGLGSTSYYENHDASSIMGFELSLNYHKNYGDHRFAVGGWATAYKYTYDILADDIYNYDWQKKTGTSNGAYWGYECLGKFKSEEEIASSALYSSDTKIGDLKYKDLNDDGIIDDNDIAVVGKTTPNLRYALNFDYGYKNFDLSIVGTGRAFYQIAMTNDYFWSGWGSAGYSKFVADNIGGDYPVLSYDKSNNNFVKSDFWLRDGGWFKIQNVALSYTLDMGAKSKLDKIIFTIRGNNLLTFTKVKYVDPESIDAGVSEMPLFRTITAAVKIKF